MDYEDLFSVIIQHIKKNHVSRLHNTLKHNAKTLFMKYLSDIINFQSAFVN